MDHHSLRSNIHPINDYADGFRHIAIILRFLINFISNINFFFVSFGHQQDTANMRPSSTLISFHAVYHSYSKTQCNIKKEVNCISN